MNGFVHIEEVTKFCDRVRQVNTIRPCPVCIFTPGEFDTPDNMGPGIPVCPVCKGTGYVDLAHICCCGMPAVFWKDELIYCGRDACLASMKNRRTMGLGC